MQNEDSVVVVEDNLDDFSNEFFGTGRPEEKNETVKNDSGDDKPATEQEDDETDETQDQEEQETSDEEETTESDNPEDESKFKLGKKKLTARERVEQAVARQREEERLRIAAEERAKLLEEQLRNRQEEKKTDVKETPFAGPSPDDKTEAGEDKYPLGEYDPEYIRDLHRHASEQARIELAKEFQKQQDEAIKIANIRTMQAEWESKVAVAEEVLPDIRSKGFELEQALTGTDPAVIEDLAMTIMTLKNGPEVLYYLSEHVDEAREIAKGGINAILALGRLDGMVKPAVKTERIKVSDAPEPPPVRTRGTNGKFTVAPDTDDLEAFEQQYFKRK